MNTTLNKLARVFVLLIVIALAGFLMVMGSYISSKYELSYGQLFYALWSLPVYLFLFLPWLFKCPVMVVLSNARLIAQAYPGRFTLAVILLPVILLLLLFKPKNPDLFA